MKALIIVDMQFDFLPGGNLAVNHGDEIIPYINNIIKEYDIIIFTQDFHPSNHGSFASQHDLEPFVMINLNGIEQVAWPDHCIQGTHGADIHPDILYSPNLKDKSFYIFKKGLDPEYDSYSGFFDANGATTGLSEFLKRKGVTENHIVGLAADYCVAYTAKDSAKEGFKTFVHRKGTKAIGEFPNLLDYEINVLG